MGHHPIEPGASVIFASNSYAISVAGELAAVGTTAQPVTLDDRRHPRRHDRDLRAASHVRITGAPGQSSGKASSAPLTTNDATIVNASSSGSWFSQGGP
ncbi:MAG: hypothetical protein IPL61_27375 [Myxococcales bacterium]|nr:hypothetical protein [Myxococcales bacterium]